MGVEVGDALLVVHAALRVHVVVDGAAVLGDVEGNVGVLPPDPHEHLREALRVHGPAHRGLLPRVRHDGPGVEVGEGHLGVGLLRRVADHVTEVVVDAEKIQGGRDPLQVPFLDEGEVGAALPVVGEDVVRVRAAEERVEVEAVGLTIHPSGGLPIGFAVAPREGRVQVQGDAEPIAVRGGSHRAHPLHREAVGEQEVVGGREGRAGVLQAGGVQAVAVAQPGGDPGLVQGDPVRDRVRERPVDDLGVLREPLGRLPARPAAPVLEGLGQVPVVEREHRLDAPLPEAVDEPPVEVQALPVNRPAPDRLDAGPGDGEAVGLQPDLGHQVEVLFQAVVVVAGYVSGVAVEHLARRVGEGVPDRGAPPPLVRGALDLVRGRRGAPQKTFGKVHVSSDSYRRLCP